MIAGCSLRSEIFKPNREAIVSIQPPVDTARIGPQCSDSRSLRPAARSPSIESEIASSIELSLPEIRREPVPAIHLPQVMCFGDHDVPRIAVDEKVDDRLLRQSCSITLIEKQMRSHNLARHNAANKPRHVLGRALAKLERAGHRRQKRAVVPALRQALDELHQQVRAALRKRIDDYRRTSRKIFAPNAASRSTIAAQTGGQSNPSAQNRYGARVRGLAFRRSS